jgi:hypothetical protein
LSDLARLLLFAGTLGLGVRVCLTRGPRRNGEAAVFVGLVLGLSLAAGLLRQDAWPFTRYAMWMYAPPGTESSEVVVRGIDAGGREVPIDPFAFSPLFPTALGAWVERAMPALTPSEREEAMAFLLARAEESRRREAAGLGSGSARWLGGLGAPPDWGLYRRAHVDRPYRGLRIYRARWTLGSEKRWTLLSEYRAP